ncbi:MAG: hypothetical protein ACTSRP_09330 [Candidatus Helarchaeota archaeon]
MSEELENKLKNVIDNVVNELDRKIREIVEKKDKDSKPVLTTINLLHNEGVINALIKEEMVKQSMEIKQDTVEKAAKIVLEKILKVFKDIICEEKDFAEQTKEEEEKFKSIISTYFGDLELGSNKQLPKAIYIKGAKGVKLTKKNDTQEVEIDLDLAKARNEIKVITGCKKGYKGVVKTIGDKIIASCERKRGGFEE